MIRIFQDLWIKFFSNREEVMKGLDVLKFKSEISDYVTLLLSDPERRKVLKYDSKINEIAVGILYDRHSCRWYDLNYLDPSQQDWERARAVAHFWVYGKYERS